MNLIILYIYRLLTSSFNVTMDFSFFCILTSLGCERSCSAVGLSRGSGDIMRLITCCSSTDIAEGFKKRLRVSSIIAHYNPTNSLLMNSSGNFPWRSSCQSVPFEGSSM